MPKRRAHDPTPRTEENERQFEAFYARYYPYVRRVVWSLLYQGDPADDPDDLIQDVFAQAWNYFWKLKDSETCHNWLRMVARHAVSWRRYQYLHHIHALSLNAPLTSDEPDSLCLVDCVPGPPVLYDDPLVTEEIEKQVGEHDLQLLRLRSEGYSVPEIAAARGRTTNGTHRSMELARRRARGKLLVA